VSGNCTTKSKKWWKNLVPTASIFYYGLPEFNNQNTPMSKPAIGAVVQYCGHKATFIADIFEIEGVNVVRANFTPKRDLPSAFVVPKKQVKELRK
jgi:hypothetical protein